MVILGNQIHVGRRVGTSGALLLPYYLLIILQELAGLILRGGVGLTVVVRLVVLARLLP